MSLQGFPEDLARSFGEDATLGNVLQMLDKHYGIVMTFDTLSKKLYSLKQRMGENMTKFGVHLSQQVQILQTEYTGRIEQDHVEEVKQDHFYEGLNPKYWQMLAHKVNGENPVTYSELLLAALKLKRQAEARHPLLLKTTTTGSSNVTHSHSQGNLFLSRKLKGSHTFTAQSAAVEDPETEEVSGPKPDGDKEAKCSAEEDTGMSGEVGSIDQSLGYIVQVANAVELYQKKNCNCFGCGSPDHLVKTYPKDLGKTARKVDLNLKEGMANKGGQTSLKFVVAQQATTGKAPWT